MVVKIDKPSTSHKEESTRNIDITSVDAFLYYVTSTKYTSQNLTTLNRYCKKVFLEVRESFKGWRTCIEQFTQDRQVRQLICRCDALFTVVTAEQIEMVNSSEPYVEGRKAITQVSQGKHFSDSKFTNARDLLINNFSIVTGTSPQALNNAHVKDYETCHSDDRKKNILVSKHNSSKDGPALLGMNQEPYHLMDIFCEIHTTPVCSPKSPLSKKMVWFRPGAIAKCLSRFFEKSGVTAHIAIQSSGNSSPLKRKRMLSHMR